MKIAPLKMIWYNFYKPRSGTIDGESLIYWLAACLFEKKYWCRTWLIITGTQIEEKGKESENTKNEIQNLSIS